MPKTTTPSSNREQTVRCPRCQALVTKATLNEHIKSAHAQTTIFNGIEMPAVGYQYYVNCTICKGRVAQKRLAKHMRKVHGITNEASSNHQSLSVKTKMLKESASKKGLGNQSSPTGNNPKPYEAQRGTRRLNSTTSSTPSEGSKKPNIRPFPRKRRPGMVANANRAHVTKDIYNNMVGNWQDVDTSTHRGVTAPKGIEPSGSLADQLIIAVGSQIVICPVCKKDVYKAKLDFHMRQEHKSKRKSKSNKGATSGVENRLKSTNERSTSQHRDDDQDGSKHLSHFRRESSGQFGSYPLHDDYSDESNAD